MKTKVFLAYIFEFLRDGYYVGIFLLLPFIVKDLHLTLFQAGSLQTVISILVLLLAFPTVSWLFKYGEIRLLLFSLLLYIVVFLGFSFSFSYIALFLFFAVLGAAFALYATISNHIRITWFDRQTRGKELGNLMAVGDVAKVLFSCLTGLVAGLIGWRFTSFSLGIVTGFIFFGCMLFMRKQQSHVSKIDQEQIQPSTHSYGYFLRQKRFLLALITGGLDEGINAPYYAFLPFLLLVKGVPILFLGLFAGLYYSGNVISRLVFGRLVDRIGSAKIVIILEFGMALLTVSIAISSSLLLVGTLVLVLGFITEGTDPATSAMAAEALENVQNPQKASGLKTIANGIAKAIFPFLIGFAATELGIVVGFYILAVASLLPIIPALLFVQEKNNIQNIAIAQKA